jgi:hypothetical protein
MLRGCNLRTIPSWYALPILNRFHVLDHYNLETHLLKTRQKNEPKMLNLLKILELYDLAHLRKILYLTELKNLNLLHLLDHQNYHIHCREMLKLTQQKILNPPLILHY